MKRVGENSCCDGMTGHLGGKVLSEKKMWLLRGSEWAGVAHLWHEALMCQKKLLFLVPGGRWAESDQKGSVSLKGEADFYYSLLPASPSADISPGRPWLLLAPGVQWLSGLCVLKVASSLQESCSAQYVFSAPFSSLQPFQLLGPA